MIALLLSFSASAVPMQLTHQGRLFDATGTPLQGSHSVQIGLYLAPSGGSALWQDDLTIDFDNGYFVALLGADELSNPLEDSVLDGSTRYVGVAVDGTAIPTRQSVVSVPYARRAGVASGVSGGGIVDASEIRINGSTVLDSAGFSDPTLGGLACNSGQVAQYDGVDWVCAAFPTPSWTTLADIPADIDDGDDDTLAGFTCSDDQIVRFNVSLDRWTCGDDNVGLSASDITSLLAATATDLAPGSTLDGSPLLTAVDWSIITNRPAGLDDGDDDTQLSEAEVETFVTNAAINLATGSQVGGADILTAVDWSIITNRPAGLDDGDDDTQLSEVEVETFVTNAAIDLAAGSTVGGDTVLTDARAPWLPNQLHNGDFDIWQRGTTSPPDLWGSSGGISFASTGAAAAITNTNSGDFAFTKIEDPAAWAGMPITVALDVLANAGVGGRLVIDDGVSTTETPLPASGRVTLSHTVDASPTRLGLAIYPGTAGSDSVTIDRVMLVGGTWGDVPFVPAPLAAEQTAAERYYETGVVAMYSDDGAENPGNAFAWNFRTTKAVAPSMSFSVVENSGNLGNFTGRTINLITPRGFRYDQENNDPENSGGASGYKLVIDYVATVPITW